MLTISDYLLVKLNEESVELSDAAIALKDNKTKTNKQELSDEINDLYGIIAMLPYGNINITEKSTDAIEIINSYREEVIAQSAEAKACCPKGCIANQLLQKMAVQALSVAKMACKCLVFGLSEIYVNTTLHNTLRLSIEIHKLIVITEHLDSTLSDIEILPDKQARKRAKMLKYMPISLEQGVLDEHCLQLFTDIVRTLDGD